MDKKRSNILVLFLILFGSSGLSFLLNMPIESTIDNPNSTIEREELIVPSTSVLMDSIVMDGVVNSAEWINASHVDEFYLDLDNSGANVDGNHYMYIGEDSENLYIGLDLCGDQSNDPTDEWVALWLNTNETRFDNYFEWGDALNNGVESLIHDVENDRPWEPFFSNTTSTSTDARNYLSEEVDIFNSINGTVEGGFPQMVNDNNDYFNISSVQNNTRHITWVNFEFNVSNLFPVLGDNHTQLTDYFQFIFRGLNNVTLNSSKIVFWYNNGTYDFTDSNYVFDINTGTSESNTGFFFYPENLTVNETIKFSIFGNHSAPFKQQFEVVYLYPHVNQTNKPTDDVKFPISTLLEGDYEISWSFAPSSNNATSHRQFEIKIPFTELEGYDHEYLGVIVGGYGTSAFENSDYWEYSMWENTIDEQDDESHVYYYMDDNPELNSINLDGAIDDYEWINSSHKIEFYLDVDSDNADANNYMYLADDDANLYVGLDLCSDITNNTADEWVGVWLNTISKTFSSETGWYMDLDKGAETFLYSVENEALMPLFEESIVDQHVTDSTSYSDQHINVVQGTITDGNSNSMRFIDSNYFNVTSSINETRTDFSIDIGKMYDPGVLYGKEQIKGIEYINIDLRSLLNTTVASNKLVVWYENGTLNQNDPNQIITINDGPTYTTENLYLGGGNLTSDKMLKFSIIGNHTSPFEHDIEYMSFDCWSRRFDYLDDLTGGSAKPFNTINSFEINWTFGPSVNNLTAHRQFEIRIPRSELEYYRTDHDLGIFVGGYGTMAFPGSNWWVYGNSVVQITPNYYEYDKYNYYDMSNITYVPQDLPQINPIAIDDSLTGVGAHNWTWARNQSWCTQGDGSWANPYIIENLYIDAYGTNYGIEVKNSEVYFEIRGCTILNSGNGAGNAGINLRYVNNSRILNNNCSNNGASGSGSGISLAGDTSNKAVVNNTFSGNILSFNGVGIWFYYETNDNIIYNNTIFNNTQYGIQITGGGVGNTVEENHIYHNTGSGIYISDENNIIRVNNVSLNGNDGIHNEGGDGNLIEYNIAMNNSNNGILIDGDSCTIRNNIANNNSGRGIYVEQGDGHIIEDNNCSYNKEHGIHIGAGTETHRIQGNTISFNTESGLSIAENSHNTQVRYNFIYNNSWAGIYMNHGAAGSENITILGNIIHDSGPYGLDLWSDSFFNLTISGNTIYNFIKITGDTAMSLNSVINGTITGNTIYNCNEGVKLANDNNNTLISNNKISNSPISVNILDADNNDNRIIGNLLDGAINDIGTNTIKSWNVWNWTLTDIIIIDNNGNGNFTWVEAEATLAFVTGSGTPGDRYIMCNFMLNCSNASSGIIVNNSAVYFTIQNVTVYNSSMGDYDGGIVLISVQNAILKLNNCSMNQGNGIVLISSTNCQILNNIANNNGINGIFLSNSDNNVITGNTASFNTNAGVKLLSSDNCYITNNANSFFGNFIGILLIASHSNTITGNSIGNCNVGVWLLNSNNNVVNSNTYKNVITMVQDEGTGNVIGLTHLGDDLPEDLFTVVFLTILFISIGIIVGYAVLNRVYPEKMDNLKSKFKEITDKLSARLRPEKGSERYGKFTLSSKSLPIKRKQGPVVISEMEKKLVAEKPKSIPTPEHKPKPTPRPAEKPEVKPEPKPAIKPALDEDSLQKKYKEATGKDAIWRGAETKAYKDWKANQ